jgi:hypothetical protein
MNQAPEFVIVSSDTLIHLLHGVPKDEDGAMLPPQKPVSSLGTKKLLIESQSSNGRCYLRLLSSLPSYRTCTPKILESVIIDLSTRLGQNPESKEILPYLVAAELMMRNEHEELNWDFIERTLFMQDQFMKDSSSLMKYLMRDNTSRFGFEEIGGVYHIGHYIVNDPCDSIMCDHGWAPRFIMAALTRDGARIGATIDIDQLFIDVLSGNDEAADIEDYRSCITVQQSRIKELEQKLDNTNNALEREFTRKNDDGSEEKVINSRLNLHKTPTIEQYLTTNETDIEKIINDKIISIFEGMRPQPLSSRSELGLAKGKAESLLPDDSSSQLERYNRSYMPEGTVYDITGKGTQLAIAHKIELPKITEEQEEVNVVQGFIKTETHRRLEKESLSKLAPINGLANPFKSSRLNLLCHFHTALQTIDTGLGVETNYDRVKWLNDYEAKNPSQELAYQMIVRTFCFRTGSIIANPFKFPYIEVGMLISDDCLYKSFDLMRSEYKTLWFDEMKSLAVPSFHDDYRGFRDYRKQKKAQPHPKNYTPSSSRQSILNGKSKGTKSILSVR